MKRCNGAPLFQGEKCRCLWKPLPFLGCKSTVVSGEKVCGSDGFNISLDRADWDSVFL